MQFGNRRNTSNLHAFLCKLGMKINDQKCFKNFVLLTGPGIVYVQILILVYMTLNTPWIRFLSYQVCREMSSLYQVFSLWSAKADYMGFFYYKYNMMQDDYTQNDDKMRISYNWVISGMRFNLCWGQYCMCRIKLSLAWNIGYIDVVHIE